LSSSFPRFRPVSPAPRQPAPFPPSHLWPWLSPATLLGRPKPKWRASTSLHSLTNRPRPSAPPPTSSRHRAPHAHGQQPLSPHAMRRGSVPPRSLVIFKKAPHPLPPPLPFSSPSPVETAPKSSAEIRRPPLFVIHRLRSVSVLLAVVSNPVFPSISPRLPFLVWWSLGP
jgi:hypothetical protein